MEYWSDGVLEWWSIGVAQPGVRRGLPNGLNRGGTGLAFQVSLANDTEARAEPIEPRITPLLHCSNTPLPLTPSVTLPLRKS